MGPSRQTNRRPSSPFLSISPSFLVCSTVRRSRRRRRRLTVPLNKNPHLWTDADVNGTTRERERVKQERREEAGKATSETAEEDSLFSRNFSKELLRTQAASVRPSSKLYPPSVSSLRLVFDHTMSKFLVSIILPEINRGHLHRSPIKLFAASENGPLKCSASPSPHGKKNLGGGPSEI